MRIGFPQFGIKHKIVSAISSKNSTYTFFPNTTDVPTNLNLPEQQIKKGTEAEQVTSLTPHERAARLREIGQIIRETRIAKSISLRQLHSLSLVLPNQIDILETGKIELLPEDTYVRDMIRRLGDALGLDGNTLAASLGTPVRIKTTVSKSSSPQLTIGFNFNPIHLYLSYVGFMAAAMAGLVVLSQPYNEKTSNKSSVYSPTLVPQSKAYASPTKN